MKLRNIKWLNTFVGTAISTNIIQEYIIDPKNKVKKNTERERIIKNIIFKRGHSFKINGLINITVTLGNCDRYLYYY